jgi:type II restriction enzyme
MPIDLLPIIQQFKSDPASVYNTWFINNEDRLKAFRSIRRGVIDVVDDIKAGRFGSDFKGSSLEFVLTCIAEQKQVFEGAAHPFYWKPKLRIPDIYENEANKRQFALCLERVLNATHEDAIIKAIVELDSHRIKGLGPAVASILYFLHPTMVPPCNTAIMNGFNFLFNDKKKLGSWGEYLRMREVIIDTNRSYTNELSRDLGAFAGLLYEIGTQRLMVGHDAYISAPDRKKIEDLANKRQQSILIDQQEQNLHSEMQHHLLTIGKALGYDVMCARNDVSRSFNGSAFSFLCLPCHPELAADRDTVNTIQLVDVLWFQKGTNNVIGAFEVEKSTSIYSGILRLTDLAHSIADGDEVFYLIVPDKREKEVVTQLMRPSIRAIKVPIKYILFSELRANCEAICKFGNDLTVLDRIAQAVQ